MSRAPLEMTWRENKNKQKKEDTCCILSFLSRLDKVLAMVVRERQTDLVIIEGMGRAIHTNYYAMFSCESLKMAVIKNSWLADRLGGKLFSIVFKYEVPSGKSGQWSSALTRSWAPAEIE